MIKENDGVNRIEKSLKDKNFCLKNGVFDQW